MEQQVEETKKRKLMTIDDGANKKIASNSSWNPERAQESVLNNTDMLVQIFAFVDLPNLINCSLVSKKWNASFKAEKTWAIKFAQQLTGSFEFLSTQHFSGSFWKQHFQLCFGKRIPDKESVVEEKEANEEEEEHEDEKDAEPEHEEQDEDVEVEDPEHPFENEQSTKKTVRFMQSMQIEETWVVLVSVSHLTARWDPSIDSYGIWQRDGNFRMVFYNPSMPDRYILLDGKEKFEVTENIPDFDSDLTLNFKLHLITQHPDEAQTVAVERKNWSPHNKPRTEKDPSVKKSQVLCCPPGCYNYIGKHQFRPEEFVKEGEFLGVKDFLQVFWVTLKKLLRSALRAINDDWYTIKQEST